MINMDDATIDELVERFHMGKETAARAKAAAKVQRDPDYAEAEALRQRLNKMGVSPSIETALEMVKGKKTDGNND